MGTPDYLSWWELLGLIIVALLFVVFGEGVGWRGVGLLQVAFSIQLLRRKEVPVGVEGKQPRIIIRGPLAIFLGIVSLGLGVMLVFFPEQTVMRFWSGRQF